MAPATSAPKRVPSNMTVATSHRSRSSADRGAGVFDQRVQRQVGTFTVAVAGASRVEALHDDARRRQLSPEADLALVVGAGVGEDRWAHHQAGPDVALRDVPATEQQLTVAEELDLVVAAIVAAHHDGLVLA